MSDPKNDRLPAEQAVRAALTAIADAPGRADELTAWDDVRTRIEHDRYGRRRRAVIALSSMAAAAAAIVAVVVLADGDDRETVQVGPVDTPTTVDRPTTTVPATATSTPSVSMEGFPARPLAVVVSEGDVARLDLYDADSGALVISGLATSAHSLSDVSFGPNGIVYFTEELGDSSTVRAVPWDGSAEPFSPFGAENETNSGVLSPDGRTFAYAHQGVTVDDREIILVDTATGAERTLRWAQDDEDFFHTNGRLTGLEWAPGGRRLLFVSSYEGSEPLVIDVEAASLSEAEPIPDLDAFHVHWASDDVVVGLHTCCFPEYDEQSELRWVELGGATTPTEGAGAPIAFDVNHDDVLALVRPDGTVQLLDLDTGSSTEIGLDLPASDVGF